MIGGNGVRGTAKVYINGTLAQTIVSPWIDTSGRPPNTFAWWNIADIHEPSGYVGEVNDVEYYQVEF